MTTSSNTISLDPEPNQQNLYLAELSALTEAGLAILRSQLDIDGLCELVYEHVARVVDVQGFHLGLFEKENFDIKVWVQEGQRRSPVSFPLAENEGIIGWMRSSQQALLVRDFDSEMEGLPARPSYQAQKPPRSAMFVPLVAGDRVVGTMSVQHPNPNAYSDDDLEILGIIANQAASAIVNARLFETVQNRAEQLEAIGEVARTITAVLDLDELLTTVVELVRERFSYYHVQIFLVEDESHRAIFRASSGHNLNKLWLEQGRSQPFGEGIIGWVAETGQPLVSNDVTTEPRYIADDPRLLPGTQSELAVPLKIEDRVIGVLDVQSTALDAFGQDDLFVFDALANQVAVAVDAAWSYRAQQEEAWITTVLLQVAEAANQVETLDDVLGSVTRLVPMLTGVSSCAVWLKNEELDEPVLAAAHGFETPWQEVSESLRFDTSEDTEPFLVLLRQRGQSLELSIDDDFLLPRELRQALPGDKVVLLPLLAQNQQIGALMVSLDSQEVPIRLHGKRLAMLSGIANQAAAAIESVRLASAREEQAWISWALLEISRAIGNASSVEEMLDHVVRLTPLLSGIDRCAVLLWDPEAEEYWIANAYSGRGVSQPSVLEWRLKPGDFTALDMAIAERRLQRVDDPADSELVPSAWNDLVGSKTLMVLPLLVQDQVYGALMVDDIEVRHKMSEYRQDILAGISQQVALSLENFHLQKQEEERIRLGQELQVAQSIQASFLRQAIPVIQGYELAHTWQPANEVGGDFFDFIPLSDGRVGLLMADVADKGVPAALFMAISLTLLRISAHNYRSPKEMLDRANHLVHANNDADMFVTTWYGILDPEKHQIIYANAGHSLALHVRASDGDMRQLRPPGFPLGILESLESLQETATLAPGDLLVLYTDGVVDALDPDGDEFGQDRLEGVLFGHRHESAQQIVDAVVAAVRSHARGHPYTDDLTLAVLKHLEN